MSDRKIIMLTTGNFLRYRLDLIDYSYPTVAKEKIIFLTDKCSYDTISDDYKNKYKFIFIEDCQESYPISKKYELFLCEYDEAKYNDKLKTFYSPSTGNLYPYHITRLIFPYLIENNIKNFLILDSDYVFIDNLDLINKIFDFLEPGQFHFPLFGPKDGSVYNNFYIDHFVKKYRNIKFEVKELNTWDGFGKGFHFRNLEDMKLFFDLWNDTTELLLSNYNIFTNFIEISRNMMLSSEWIIQYIVGLFKSNFNYEVKNSYSAFYDSKLRLNIGFHTSKPEEKLYYTYDVRKYPGYENFIYDGIKTVADFVKNNKEALYNFYIYRISNHIFDINITDSHVHMKIKNDINTLIKENI